jgi:hypothetical protein
MDRKLTTGFRIKKNQGKGVNGLKDIPEKCGFQALSP